MNPQDFGSATITPDTARAGQKGRWDILYTAGPHGIREGGGLRVFGPRYGYDRWTLGKVLAFCGDDEVYLEVKTENTDPPSYHYCHHAAATITVYGRDLRPGETIRVTLGAIGGYLSGRRVQAVAQSHAGPAPFNVLVDLKGNGQFGRESHRPTAYHACAGDLNVKMSPAAPAHIRLTVRGKVGVLAVEDEFANPIVDEAFDVRLFNEQGDAGAPQRVTKPASAAGVTFAVKPNGPARLAASDFQHRIYGVSNPIDPDFFGGGVHAYFGDMHVMTGSSLIPSMLGTTDSAIAYARDVSGLDFTSVTNSFNAKTWAGDVEAFKRHHRDGEFVTIPSLECGFKTGHKNVFFLEDDQPPVDSTSVEALWQSLEGRTCTAIAHHTNTHAETDPDEWGVHDLSTINPAFERHIEICQTRGSFEHDTVGDEVRFGGHGSSVRDVLSLGHRLGFVGGTDSHRGQPGLSVTNLSGLDTRAHVTGAITAVLCNELTRQSIWDALLARRCYATTCQRMLLDFSVNGHPMGTDTPATEAPRKLHIKVAGTYPLDRIVIVRNGEEIHTIAADGMTFETDWTDDAPLADVTDPTIRGVYYYIKVYQQDGNIAWASPVWFTTSD